MGQSKRKTSLRKGRFSTKLTAQSRTPNCQNWLTCSSLSKSSSSYTRISRPGLKPFFDPLPDARPSSIGHTYSSTSSCFFFLRLPKLLKASFFGLQVKRKLTRSQRIRKELTDLLLLHWCFNDEGSKPQCSPKQRSEQPYFTIITSERTRRSPHSTIAKTTPCNGLQMSLESHCIKL